MLLSLLCVPLIALAVARAPPLITLLVVRTEFPVTAGAALRFCCLPCGVSHLLTYLLTSTMASPGRRPVHLTLSGPPSMWVAPAIRVWVTVTLGLQYRYTYSYDHGCSFAITNDMLAPLAGGRTSHAPAQQS